MKKINKPSASSAAHIGPQSKISTALFASGRLAALCTLVLAVACSPGEHTDSASSSPPRVAKKYQEHLDKDWQLIEEGKAPSCAKVFGHANVALNLDENGNTNEALQAIEACYVHAIAHYVSQLLEPIKVEEASCNTLLVQGSVQRRAMRTILQGMKVDTDTLDQQLNELIGKDVERWCPQGTSTLLQ